MHLTEKSFEWKRVKYMKLSALFSNHMVFQAGKPIRIFGNGKGKITAKIAGVYGEMISDSERFCLELPSLPYGGPYTLSISLNNQNLEFNDVYIGEVLLLAGQSNIEFTLGESSYPEQNIKSNSMFRCFGFERIERENHFLPSDGWVVCDDKNVKFWSAIGYHLATSVNTKKGVAVGAFFCYHGTSVIESWMPESLVREERFYLPIEEKNYDNGFHRYAKIHMPWNVYGMLYNHMQQNIVPFSVGNVVWYQGESNSGPGEWKKYTDLLEALILCWRKDFNDSKLPFIVVQISDFDERTDDGWKGIQKAQAEIVSKELTDVFLVKSADVCESNNIHPPTKTKLSERVFNNLKLAQN